MGRMQHQGWDCIQKSRSASLLDARCFHAGVLAIRGHMEVTGRGHCRTPILGLRNGMFPLNRKGVQRLAPGHRA